MVGEDGKSVIRLGIILGGPNIAGDLSILVFFKHLRINYLIFSKNIHDF